MTISGLSEQHSNWVFSPPILPSGASLLLLKDKVRGGMFHMALL